MQNINGDLTEGQGRIVVFRGLGTYREGPREDDGSGTNNYS